MTIDVRKASAAAGALVLTGGFVAGPLAAGAAAEDVYHGGSVQQRFGIGEDSCLFFASIGVAPQGNPPLYDANDPYALTMAMNDRCQRIGSSLDYKVQGHTLSTSWTYKSPSPAGSQTWATGSVGATPFTGHHMIRWNGQDYHFAVKQ